MSMSPEKDGSYEATDSYESNTGNNCSFVIFDRYCISTTVATFPPDRPTTKHEQNYARFSSCELKRCTIHHTRSSQCLVPLKWLGCKHHNTIYTSCTLHPVYLPSVSYSTNRHLVDQQLLQHPHSESRPHLQRHCLPTWHVHLTPPTLTNKHCPRPTGKPALAWDPRSSDSRCTDQSRAADSQSTALCQLLR